MCDKPMQCIKIVIIWPYHIIVIIMIAFNLQVSTDLYELYSVDLLTFDPTFGKKPLLIAIWWIFNAWWTDVMTVVSMQGTVCVFGLKLSISVCRCLKD